MHAITLVAKDRTCIETNTVHATILHQSLAVNGQLGHHCKHGLLKLHSQDYSLIEWVLTL